MPRFNKRSLSRLTTCDERLIRLFGEVVKRFDCSVTAGHRDERTQNKLYAQGRTEPGPVVTNAPWPRSKHNTSPSIAIDVVPCPLDWNDLERFYFFNGYVLATAHQLGIPIRLGADWDGDTDLHDQRLNDLPHFELLEGV